MKCISKELIQKYIDRETSADEDYYINNHCLVCHKCVDKIETMRQKAHYIKQLIGATTLTHTEIPAFSNPKIHQKVFSTGFRKSICILSAACILFLFLFLFQKNENENKIEMVYLYDLAGEFNANLPVSEQEMDYNIIDLEHKPASYQTTRQ